MTEEYITCPKCHEDIPFIVYEDNGTIICDVCDSIYKVKHKEMIGDDDAED